MFGALLGLAGTLIGASKQEKARKRSDWMNSPQGIRANAEEAGFNPLVFAGPGVGTGAQYAPTMGTTIANGFALAGDQFQEQQALKRQKSELEQETQRLQKVVEQTTLTPNVPGVYGNGRSGTGGASHRSHGKGVVTSGEPAGVLDVRASLDESRASGHGLPLSYSDGVTAPSIRVFGKTLYGSGNFGNGESYEDALGDNPLSWVAAPFIFSDILGYSLGQYRSSKQQSKADLAMDEWFRRVREGDPYPSKKGAFEKEHKRAQRELERWQRRISYD